MRVLTVAYTIPPTFSGAQKFWFRLIPRLQDRGIVVDVLCRRSDGEVILQKTDGTNVSIAEPLGTRRGSYFGYILTVVKALWLNRHEYDCVFFNGAHDALFASLCFKSFIPLKFAYRMTMMGEDDPLGIQNIGRFGWLRVRLLRRIDAAVCTNPAMATSSQQAGIATDRVFTIPQGTDIDFFAPATPEGRNSIRHREGLPLTAKIVIFCGAVAERKGVDLLMKAWPEVVACHPTALLLLVGPDGGDSDDPGGFFLRNMTQLSQEPDYKRSVKFLGYREDARELLQASDVFVLASRMEGTPNVLLEAMASGLPIVLSDLTGVSGVFVRNDMEAFIVPQNDWQQIGVSLRRLLGDQDLARRFSEGARSRAVANYSMDSVASQYADVFNRLKSNSLSHI
jgi:glycosyltransferase involved in cell wall biosynthesis